MATAKGPHRKNTQCFLVIKIVLGWAAPVLSLSASSHSRCLLWHLLSDIFILVCDPHFVCNLRVPTCSSQACSLTIPSSRLLFFIFSFFFYSSSLTSFSFSLLNFIFFPSVYYESKTMSTVSQKHSGCISLHSPHLPSLLVLFILCHSIKHKDWYLLNI